MKYERPELDIVEFDVVDIIQASTENREEDKLPFVPATVLEYVPTTVSELDKNF